MNRVWSAIGWRRIMAGLLLSVVGSSVGWAWLAPDKSHVVELAPGVYFRKAQTEPTFTGCNQGWIVFKDFVLVIDANFPNQAAEVIKVIGKTTDKPIRYVFDTHHHGDHADGNVHFVRQGATAVASERSVPMFETKGAAGFAQGQRDKPDEYGDLTYEKPSLLFPQKLVFDDGTQRVELLHLGHAHTMGDAVAWLPKHGILFTGDACVNGAFNYTGDANTASWITVLNTLQELPVKHVAPGHGELGDASLLTKQRQYFVDLRAAVKQLIEAGRTLDKIKQEISIPWYAEWAGVDVKQRTENIEFVYGELTAKK